MRVLFLLFVVFVACVPGTSWAQSGFDIAGIKLGMSPVEAKKALKESGYAPDDDTLFRAETRGPTFQERVALEKKEISLKDATGAIKELRYVKGTESINVGFGSYPDGEEVIKVLYRNDDGAMTVERLQELAVKKYGEPHHQIYNKNYSWSDQPFNKGMPKRGAEYLTVQDISFGKPALSLSRFNVQPLLMQMVQDALSPPDANF